jgi:AI-2 transport protein TqsA
MTEQGQAGSSRETEAACLLILALTALGAAMYFLKPVLIPLLLAVFFTLCLAPIIDLQVCYLRINRKLALVTTGLAGVIVLILLGLMLASVLERVTADFAAYQQQLNQLAERVSQVLPLKRLGIKTDPETGRLELLSDELMGPLVASALGQLRSVISNGVMVVIFMMFILAGHARTSLRPGSVIAEIERQVKRYINLTVFLSATTAVLITITLAALGVKYALVFGLLIFFLNFIPEIGSVIATLLPMPVVLLSTEMSPTAKVLALVIPTAIEFVMGKLVQAKLLANSLTLHPVAVLAGLIFFGMIWDIPGAFLATPMMVVIRIVFEKTSATRPLARLLAGDLNGFASKSAAAAHAVIPPKRSSFSA